MSDLYEAREKTEKGAEWRGSINATINGDSHELTVRQLRDPEFWEVMSLIDTDELEALQSDLPEDKMEEFRDLQGKDNLGEDDEERLEELEDEMQDADLDIFAELSYDTYEGIKLCAIYGIEPDESDIQRALSEDADAVEEYGGLSRDNAKQFLQDEMVEPMIERSTDFTSFAVGVKVLGETLDDEGNSEN